MNSESTEVSKKAVGTQSIINQSGQRVDSQINIAGNYIAHYASVNLPPAHPTAPKSLVNFVGREKQLAWIAQRLLSEQVAKPVVLYGMGGIGKTAIALESAARLRTDFSGGIFWGSLFDHAGNPRPILQTWGRACSTEQLANLDLNSLVDETRNLLAARLASSGRILVVCDHVKVEWADALEMIANAIPASASFFVTTRSENLAYTISGDAQRVEAFGLTEAKALLCKQIDSQHIELEQEAVTQLLADIGYHPLAIDIAAKRLQFLLRKPGQTIAQFGLTLRENPLAELIQPGMSRLDVVASISYESLAPLHRECFCCIGLFVTGSITVLGIAAAANFAPQITETILDELVSAALIDLTEVPQEYVIHPLLHQYARQQMKTLADLKTKRQNHACFCLDFARANAQLNVDSHNRLARRLPDLIAAFEHFQSQQQHEQVIEFADLLYTESRFLEIRGYMEEAELLLSAAVCSARLLQDHRRAGHHLVNLGAVYLDIGQTERAFILFEQAMTCLETVDDRSLALALLDNIGRGCQATGDLYQASANFQQALKLAFELDKKSEQCILYGNLGNIYRELKQYKDAIECYHLSHALAQEINDRRNEGITLGNLAALYECDQQANHAISYYSDALAIANEIGDTRNQGIWLGHLGDAHAEVELWQDAINFYNQALNFAQMHRDLRHQGIWQGNLGTAYEAIGKDDDAIASYLVAIDIAQKIGDRVCERTWLNNIGTYYCRSNIPEKAVSFFERALTLSQDDEDARLSQLVHLILVYDQMNKTSQTHQEKLIHYIRETHMILSLSTSQRAALLTEWLNHIDV